jgi:hypothetical protein
MSKNITEIFSIKLNGNHYHIEARSYNSHLFNIDGEKSYCLTVPEMRELAKHLIETADKIDNDKDFNAQ